MHRWKIIDIRQGGHTGDDFLEFITESHDPYTDDLLTLPAWFLDVTMDGCAPAMFLMASGTVFVMVGPLVPPLWQVRLLKGVMFRRHASATVRNSQSQRRRCRVVRAQITPTSKYWGRRRQDRTAPPTRWVEVVATRGRTSWPAHPGPTLPCPPALCGSGGGTAPPSPRLGRMWRSPLTRPSPPAPSSLVPIPADVPQRDPVGASSGREIALVSPG